CGPSRPTTRASTGSQARASRETRTSTGWRSAVGPHGACSGTSPTRPRRRRSENTCTLPSTGATRSTARRSEVRRIVDGMRWLHVLPLAAAAGTFSCAILVGLDDRGASPGDAVEAGTDGQSEGGGFCPGLPLAIDEEHGDASAPCGEAGGVDLLGSS